MLADFEKMAINHRSDELKDFQKIEKVLFFQRTLFKKIRRTS